MSHLPKLHLRVIIKKKGFNKKKISELLAKRLLVSFNKTYADKVREGELGPLTVSIFDKKEIKITQNKEKKFFKHM